MSDASWLEKLDVDECLELLRSTAIGRVAVVADGFPVVLPVNYRVVEPEPSRVWFALRTRPGNVVDRARMHAALQIDSTDTHHQEGWSVLVRGTLHRVDPDAAAFRDRFDPEPWMVDDRDSWLVIDPFMITGRRLHAADRAWAFDGRAYL
jgi:uncharacterized protein